MHQKLDGVRQIFVFEREIILEGDAAVSPHAKHIVTAAVGKNPFAGQGKAGDAELGVLAEMSATIGALLTERALSRFDKLSQPRAYGKAVIVGFLGEREHGAALIHSRLGAPMRAGLGGAPALIPGIAKTGCAGTSVDITFGDVDNVWNFNSMDSMTVAVPDAPAADEFVLFVGFGTPRANARIKKLS